MPTPKSSSSSGSGGTPKSSSSGGGSTSKKEQRGGSSKVSRAAAKADRCASVPSSPRRQGALAARSGARSVGMAGARSEKKEKKAGAGAGQQPKSKSEKRAKPTKRRRRQSTSALTAAGGGTGDTGDDRYDDEPEIGGFLPLSAAAAAARGQALALGSSSSSDGGIGGFGAGSGTGSVGGVGGTGPGGVGSDGARGELGGGMDGIADQDPFSSSSLGYEPPSEAQLALEAAVVREGKRYVALRCLLLLARYSRLTGGRTGTCFLLVLLYRLTRRTNSSATRFPTHSLSLHQPNPTQSTQPNQGTWPPAWRRA